MTPSNRPPNRRCRPQSLVYGCARGLYADVWQEETVARGCTVRMLRFTCPSTQDVTGRLPALLQIAFSDFGARELEMCPWSSRAPKVWGRQLVYLHVCVRLPRFLGHVNPRKITRGTRTPRKGTQALLVEGERSDSSEPQLYPAYRPRVPGASWSKCEENVALDS